MNTNIFYGYTRISTPGQSKNSIQEQLDFLKVEASKLNLPFKPIIEQASGKDVIGRPALIKLLQEVKDSDVIGFKYVDRYGRETEENLALLRILSERNILVQINGQFINYKDPTQKFTFTTLSAVGTFQSELQKQKSLIGIQRKKESGDWVFPGRTYGYRIFEHRKGIPLIGIVKKEAEILKYIFENYAKGKSILRVTKEINEKGFRTREGNVFFNATVRRYILKPIYKGFYSHNRKLIKSNHYPTIITEELWNRANESFRNIIRKHSKQFKYSNYLLTGILKCFSCKKSYVHNFHKSKAKSEKVNENYVHKIYNNCQCEIGTFRAFVLEQIFQTCYALLYMNPLELSFYFEAQKEKYEKEINKDIEINLDRINKQLKTVETGLKNIAKAIIQGHDSETLLSESSKLQSEKKDLITHKNELLQSRQFQEDELDILFESFNEENLEKFSHANSEQRRIIYIDTIQNAYVFKKQLIIRFKNQKTFVIPLIKNRGSIIQKNFGVKVYFQGKYQYPVLIDINKKDFFLNEDENIEKDKFNKSFILNKKNRIADLKKRLI